MDLWIITGPLLLLAAAVLVWTRLFRPVTVYEHEHAVRFDRGRFAGVVPPGRHWVSPFNSSIERLEARPRVTTIPGQEVLSSDGVSIKVSLLLEYKVADPKTAVLAAESYSEALYARAQIALRSAIGQKTIEEVLESRAQLGDQLQTDVAPRAESLGLELLSIGIKDVMFPGALKDAFSQTARARQEGQAILERARGETAALRNLANAARLLDDNPNLFQLRLLQASEAGHVVVNVPPPKTATD